MSASQRVRLSNGSLRTNPEIGIWRYNSSADHSHWHLIHFQRYELRRPGGSVVVRDRKSGFCIGDRYGVAPGRIEWSGPGTALPWVLQPLRAERTRRRRRHVGRLLRSLPLPA